MPCKIDKIKDFLLTARWKDAKSIKIKKKKDIWSKFDAADTFYSLVFTDKEKAETLKAVPDPRFGIEGAEMNLAHSLELY